jgi:large subunit ribosomal protein L31
MKKDIHPDYRGLEVQIGNDIFTTKSVYTGQTKLLMDVDYRKHPAWTKKGIQTANESEKTIAGFNAKFAGLSFGLPKKQA